MQHQLTTLLATLLLATFSMQAMAECDTPAAPIIPDGNVASEDELVAAQKAMKMFQGSLADYRTCLATAQEALDAKDEANTDMIAELNDKYNVSIDAETGIAEEFNTAVRMFKSRQ